MPGKRLVAHNHADLPGTEISQGPPESMQVHIAQCQRKHPPMEYHRWKRHKIEREYATRLSSLEPKWLRDH